MFSFAGECLPKQSRCDCPNGWLFCCHTLAYFLLFILSKKKQTGHSRILFSSCIYSHQIFAQNTPFAASYIFVGLNILKPGSKLGKKNKDDEYKQMIAHSIVAGVPGYSGKYSITTADAAEEGNAMKKDMENELKDIKNVDSNKIVDDKFQI